MALGIFEGARGQRFVCDKGTGQVFAQISIDADAPIVSCAREQAAEPFLHELGKMSQRQLYECAEARKRTGVCPPNCHGNCNPANPPGASTHERRNDGLAYRAWPRLFRLPKWARGIDVQRDRVPAFLEECRRQGFVATQTYPGSPSESQHVNLRKKPKINWWRLRPVKRGSGGPRARQVVTLLKQAVDPQTREPYLSGAHHVPLDGGADRAIRAFQRDHHQKRDGNVGVHTIAQLRAAARRPSVMSQRGLDMIRRAEGLRLYAYDDPAGNATVGYGHLLHLGQATSSDRHRYGSQQQPGMTKKEAEALLLDDVAKFEQAVLDRVPYGMRGNRNRFDALVDAAFNLGPGIFDPGRTMGDALRSGQSARVADAFLVYVKDGNGKTLPGLVARRKAERALYLRKP